MCIRSTPYTPKHEDMMNFIPGNTTLFVGNLSVFTTPRDLHAAFAVFGDLEVRLKPGNEGRSNCGFGFVQYTSRECAESAYLHMQGALFMGRVIRWDCLNIQTLSIDGFNFYPLFSHHSLRRKGRVGNRLKIENKKWWGYAFSRI